MTFKSIMAGASVATLLLLAGCKTTEPLYYHGDYNTVVYSYFKAEDVTLEEQISAMQNLIATAHSKGKPVAPGVHGHLGMLYFETGNTALGVEHLNTEKQLFPESAKFMDFLLNQSQEGRNEAAQ